MQKKVFQVLADNTSGVLSRISGLFSRRGYNSESITAGVTADPKYTRITIVTNGDEDVLEQIEKQVAKLVDVEDIKELTPTEQMDNAFRSINEDLAADLLQKVLEMQDQRLMGSYETPERFLAQL